jgi:ABC-type glycerol-3-phosphate transport system substrate-binding protein
MKKATALVLALTFVLTASVFAGPGGDAAGSTASGKTIVKLGNWPEATLTGDIAMHQNWVKQFNAKYPDITIQPAYYFYSLDTVIPMAEAGQLPTIFEPWYTEPAKLIGGGFVKDVTAEVKALGWDAKMSPAVKDLLSRNGKLYGVPRDGYALGIMLNVELFRQAGLVDSNGLPRYPKTWDELAITAQTIKRKTGAAGLCLLAKDNAGGWHFTNIAWGFGAQFAVQRNGKWVAQVNSPEAIAAMNYVKDLRWQYDALTVDPTSEDWGTGFQQIGAGNAAMYIAANDAVNQPTQVNGLPVGDLALAPVPAGPKGQYSLMGGTIYMFANNATPAEVTGALRYLEIMGRGPNVDATTIAGLEADASNRKNSGIPVLPPFPVWTDSALLKAQKDSVAKHSNVDMRLYQDYFDMVAKAGNLRTEEYMAQELYAELTKVIQAVVTDRNADVTALMNTAQANFQKILDAAPAQ